MMELASIASAVLRFTTGALGLSPTARRRTDIARDVRLHETLKSKELTWSARRLELLLNRQVEDYCIRREKAMDRMYNWATLVFGGILSIALLLGSWQFYPARGWDWAGLITFGLAGALVPLGSIGAFAFPSAPTSEAKTLPNDDSGIEALQPS